MPVLDRKSPGLVPNNARNADVASRLIDQIAAMQQQRTQAAHRVQGIPAILYSRINQGRPCLCHKHNNETARLSPDGKASTGAINRAIAGNTNFGISKYNPQEQDIELDPYDAPTSPLGVNQWGGDLNIVGGIEVGNNQVEIEATMGDNGQFSPDFDDMFKNFDMSTLGFSDVSCPICFGTGYVGGYSPFRTWRHVVVPTELQTDSFFDLPSFELSRGTHKVTVTLPKGAISVDAFRVMLNTKPVPATIYVDGTNITVNNYPVIRFFDGRPHELTIECDGPLTHIELQAAVSSESVYFEIPKLTRTADISFLDQQEPFQIIVSPEIPSLQSLDIIAEQQLGKVLIVQQANQWNTKNKQMLGWDCQVRVAQPQELWNILPQRRTTSQKRTMGSRPAKLTNLSGMKGFTF